MNHRTTLDFLELQIATGRCSNAWTLQKLLDEQSPGTVPWVEPLDAGPGGAARIFRFRVHDPTTFERVEGLLEQLQHQTGFSDAPKLTALELALDTYQVQARREDLAAVVLNRCRWSTHKPNQDWHAYRERDDGRKYLNQLSIRDAERHLASGWNVADSPTKNVDVRYHGYVKVTDATRPLPPEKWRARFEVTLRGDALPVREIEQMRGFDFCCLAHLFRFQKYADESPHPAIAAARTAMSAGYQVGERGPYRRRHATEVARYSGSREFRGWTAKDTELNAAVYAELRRLTRLWRSTA